MSGPQPASPSVEGFGTSLNARRSRVDARLPLLLPADDVPPTRVHQAMRYALLSPGKRLRPVLTLTVAQMLAGSRLSHAAALDIACAVEMVHACSLVLDDMPMMDNAQLRRGQPTVHQAYGEDVAALAAFGLLNLAFSVVAARGLHLRLDRYSAEDLLHHLTAAVGSDGLIGGQALDLEGRGEPLDLDQLEYVHSHKTGALFLCAAELGGMIADARRRELSAIASYAKNLGLAFQITDDLLDVERTAEETGKDSGQDADRQTFVTLLGTDGARALAAELLDFAEASLDGLGAKAEDLRIIARAVRNRKR